MVNSVVATFEESICCSGESEFMLGMRGFYGDTTTSSYLWGWDITSNTTKGAVLTVTIDKGNLLSTFYSLVQIGEYYTVSESSSSGVNAVLVISLALCVCVIVVVVILIYVYKRRHGGVRISGIPSMVTAK